MIEVTGSKTQPRDADAGQRYVLKDADRKTNTPAVLGAFLMGLALYLKAIFPSREDAGVYNPMPEDTPEGKAAPDMVQTSSLDRPVLDEAATGSVPKPDSPLGSGGPILGLIPPFTYLEVDPPEISFLQPEIEITWQPRIPSIGGAAANDNAAGSGSGGNGTPAVSEDPKENEDEHTPPNEEASCNEDDPCSEECDDDVTQPNRAPRVTGPVYLLDVTGCAILGIALSDLLRNAVDPDGDMLSVQNLTVSSGTLIQTATGWDFDGAPQFLGPVTITYQITDGEFTISQTAHFTITKSFIGGTDCDDLLVGTSCADDIVGGSGADNIDGRAGDDTITGDDGDDHIVGGSGHDTLFGGTGNDIIFGGTGNDHISGGAGNDRLFGDEGDDIIFGDAGDDYLSGGNGDDLLSGGSGNDEIDGGEGNDLADGGAGDDRIRGGAGDDVLTDGIGADIVFGGSGDDHVIAALDTDDDFYDGGSGCDTLDYSATTQGVTIDFGKGTASGVEIGNDTISGFETLVGGSGDDHFVVAAAPMIITGGGGENLFEFTLPPSIPCPEPVRHQILDFELGDRVRMSKYDIFERALDRIEDDFEDVYGFEIDDDDIVIRYRQDTDDTTDRSIIEADLNKDGIFETTINIEGHRALVFIEIEHA